MVLPSSGGCRSLARSLCRPGIRPFLTSPPKSCSSQVFWTHLGQLSRMLIKPKSYGTNIDFWQINSSTCTSAVGFFVFYSGCTLNWHLQSSKQSRVIFNENWKFGQNCWFWADEKWHFGQHICRVPTDISVMIIFISCTLLHRYLANEEISMHESNPAKREIPEHDVHDIVDMMCQCAFIGVRDKTH